MSVELLESDAALVSDALSTLFYSAPNRRNEVLRLVERYSPDLWLEGDAYDEGDAE